MKIAVIFLLLLSLNIQAKYYDSESCNECHEDIYYEHTKSMHHKSSLFADEVHRKMKETISKDKYACALCHMPATSNLAGIIRGIDQPNPNDKRQTDGVSCAYCHQISKIYHGKTYNINFSSAKHDEKPTMFGNLERPDDSDKHHAEHNEIYKNSEVCMGCHSHKENVHEMQVCNTLDQHGKTSDCIGCHMPKAPGGNEKFNKRGRDEYATHEFLGIHSAEMVKKAVELKLAQKDDQVTLTIINKMGHKIITQPMRLKFVKTVVSREGKIIWSNFEKNPMEDKDATFAIVFKDSEGHPTHPGNAVAYKINQNLEAMGTKTVTYKINDLQKGDKVISTWVSYVIKPKIAKKMKLSDKALSEPMEGFSVKLIVE
ncbi:MAG: multiheme c-type cytochrome [Campylobacterota bacterium]|nr:multiheme c-type cytochrome [Campylobacterota bacterium]